MWMIDFYEDEHGRCPVAVWLDTLPLTKRGAMIAAIEEILAYEGPGICGTRYGRALGSGLYELRVRHTAAELRARFRADDDVDPQVSTSSTPGV
jgi:hypothetical protein